MSVNRNGPGAEASIVAIFGTAFGNISVTARERNC